MTDVPFSYFRAAHFLINHLHVPERSKYISGSSKPINFRGIIGDNWSGVTGQLYAARYIFPPTEEQHHQAVRSGARSEARSNHVTLSMSRRALRLRPAKVHVHNHSECWMVQKSKEVVTGLAQKDATKLPNHGTTTLKAATALGSRPTGSRGLLTCHF